MLVLFVIVGQNCVRGLERQFQILTEFKAKLAIRVFVIVDVSLLRPNSRREDTDVFKFVHHQLFWLFVLYTPAIFVTLLVAPTRLCELGPMIMEM